MFDFNDADPQSAPMGSLIPDGTFAKLQLKIKPGGVNHQDPADNGLLTASKNSDVKYLNCELRVVDGPHARRVLFQSYTISGGKLYEKGHKLEGQSKGWNVTRSAIKAMIEGATGLDPNDKSDAAAAKRKAKNFSQLNGIIFPARIMIQPGENGNSDQNKIANILTKADEHYEAVMRGEHVKPEPVGAQPKKAKANAATPAWGGGDSAPASSWGSSPAPAPAAAPAWLS